MTRKEYTIISLLIFAAVIVCYGNMLSSGFIWDDQFLVVKNPIVRAPLWSGYLFTQDIANSSSSFTIYYRPVQMLSYAIDYRLWGLNPSGFHLTNILIHFLNGLLVFFLIKVLTGLKPAAFLAALFFVVCPAHAGSVSYIAGRADLLFSLFGSSSILCFVLFRKRGGALYLAGSSVFFIISILSKETAIVIPFLILLTDAVLLRKSTQKFRLIYHAPIFLLAGCYAVLHHHFFGIRYGIFTGDGGTARHVLAFLQLLKEFFILGIVPAGSYMRRSSSSDGSLLLFYCLAGAAIFIFFRVMKNSRRQLSFSLGFFVVALLPLFFILQYFNVYAEHWMYLASFGLFLFEAIVLTFLYTEGSRLGRTFSVLLIAAAIAYSSAVTVSQNRYWTGDTALSDRILEYSQNDRAALHYKAVSSFQSGDTPGSLELAGQYAASYGNDPMVWYTKGRLEFAAGNYKTALNDFKTALRLDPDYANAYLGLSFVAFEENDNERGIRNLFEAIRIEPTHREALTLLTGVYLKERKYPEALEAAKAAKKVNPYDYNTLINLGTAYTRMGDSPEGARCYLTAIRLYPENPVPYYNLAILFHESDMENQALLYLNKALKAAPNFKPALKLLYAIRK